MIYARLYCTKYVSCNIRSASNLLVIVGIVILAYTGRIDTAISSVLIAFVLGFLFGKLK